MQQTSTEAHTMKNGLLSSYNLVQVQLTNIKLHTNLETKTPTSQTLKYCAGLPTIPNPPLNPPTREQTPGIDILEGERPTSNEAHTLTADSSPMSQTQY